MDNFTLHVNNLLKYTTVRESTGEKVVLKQEEDAEAPTNDMKDIAAANTVATAKTNPAAPAANAANQRLSQAYTGLISKLSQRVAKLNSSL